MQINIFERNLTGAVKSQHNHTHYPEEKDIVSGFQYICRIKILKILTCPQSLFGICHLGFGISALRKQGQIWPLAGREPSVKHIRVLFVYYAFAFGTGFMEVN